MQLEYDYGTYFPSKAYKVFKKLNKKNRHIFQNLHVQESQ